MSGSISTLWSLLSGHIEEGNFSFALTTLRQLFEDDKELRKNPSLLHYKIYCLIQNDEFNSAVNSINVLKSSQQDLFAILQFELAYSLYKLNQFEKSLSTINQHRQNGAPKGSYQSYIQSPVNWNSKNDQKFALLEAQVLYRLGLYKESTALYEQFYQHDTKDHLVAVNLLASRACLGLVVGHDETIVGSQEAAFNSACLAIEQGNFSEARRLVDLAEDEWRNSNDQDQSDYNAIEAQRAYLDLLDNKTSDAAQIYSNMLSAPIGKVDPALLIVARNNLSVINNDPSLIPILPGIPLWFLQNCSNYASSNHSLTKLSQDSGYRGGISIRLTQQQLLPIIANTAYGMLKTNRSRECRRYLEGLDFSVSLIQLRAQLEIAENQSEAAINQLVKAAKCASTDSLKTRLFISALIISIQANLPQLTHFITRAIAPLSFINSSLDSDTSSLFLHLLHSVDHKRFTVFVNEMKLLLFSMSDSTDILPSLNAVAEAELQTGHFQSAYQLFSRMRQIEKDPIRSIIGQLKSSACFDFAVARKTMNELKSQKKDLFTNQSLTLIDPDDVAAVPISLDRPAIRTANELLKLFSSSRTLSTAVEEIQRSVGYNLQAWKTKKHRKRKPRYPKNFDPMNPGPPPDPERWLPKHERTTFKKTKRGNIKTFRGAQGVANTTTAEISTGKKTATTANVELKKGTDRRSGRRSKH